MGHGEAVLVEGRGPWAMGKQCSAPQGGHAMGKRSRLPPRGPPEGGRPLGTTKEVLGFLQDFKIYHGFL